MRTVRRAAACCVAALLLARGCAGAPAEHKVRSLPGWDAPLPVDMYAGHLDLPGTRMHAYYWLVLSERSPATDPVVMITDGGPVCSGVGLMWTSPGGSYGPFLLRAGAGGAPPTLRLNPLRWNTGVSALFIESPVGVGYSYSDDDADYARVAGDDATARATHALLLAFYGLFPELLPNDLYLHGISYSGHFIPQLAERVLAGGGGLRLVGVSVGNPATEVGSADYFQGVYGTLAGRSLLSVAAWDRLRATCDGGRRYAEWWDDILVPRARPRQGGNFSSIAPCGFPASGDCRGVSSNCSMAMLAATRDVCGPGRNPPGRHDSPTDCGINFYHLDSSIPFADPDGAGGAPPPTVARYFPRSLRAVLTADPPSLTAAYLNQSSVRVAAHAREDGSWNNCAPVASAAWPLRDIYARDISPVWRRLARAGLRLLAYNGDNDAIVGAHVTQRWVERLGLPAIGGWTAWAVDESSSAGFLQRYAGLSYATVHGAGHDVVQFQPSRLLALHRLFWAGNITDPVPSPPPSP